MGNALFGHINKRQWASVRMMFARQDAARKKPRVRMSEEQFSQNLAEKRRKRMDRIDAMSPEMRALVNEFGLTIVDAFIAHGVTKPHAIRHLVNTVAAGSINGSPTPQVRIFEDHRP